MEDKSSPYLAPSSNLAGPEKLLEIVSISRKLRLVNLIVDCAFFTIVCLVFVGVMVFLVGAQYFIDAEYGNYVVSWALLVLVYFILFEGMTGRTLGKLVTGTQVVNAHGGKATWGQIVMRSFCRFIPFEAFTFLKKSGRGLHDTLSSTYVTKSE